MGFPKDMEFAIGFRGVYPPHGVIPGLTGDRSYQRYNMPDKAIPGQAGDNGKIRVLLLAGTPSIKHQNHIFLSTFS